MAIDVNGRTVNTTNYDHPSEPNLNDLHKTMQYNATGQPQIRVHVDGISLEGDVIVERVRLWDGTNDLFFDSTVNDGEASPTVVLPTENHNMVFNGSTWDRMRGTIADGVLTQISNDYLAISKDTNANSDTNRIFVNASGTVELGATTLSALENISATVTGTVELGTTTLAALETINAVISDGGNSITVDGTVSINQPVAVTDNNGSLTVDGTVSLSQTTLDALETITVNQGTNPWTVTGNVNATISGDVSVAEMNPDAFGRQRVSELFTLGDYKHIYAIDPNFLDSTANGGTVTFVADQACAVLTTSSNTGSYAIHQTKFYHHYQPGKSQLIYSSVNFRAPHRNVTKRTGYFDDRDGIYFEQVGSDTADGSTVSTSTQTLNWVIRTYVGGSASEATFNTTVNGLAYTYKRRVPQSEWNVDKCDGTGASGFKLDITKTHLCWIDFQWLGVGRVRCGFVHNGTLITAHEYYHSNVLPTVYMSNPNLPVRCEIRNTGTTPGGAMDQICSSVMSEGGYVESGIDWSVYSTNRATPTPGQTRFPLIAIRLKNTFNGYPNRLSVRPLSLGLFAKTEPIVYEVVKLPSAASLSTTSPGGLVWTSADTNSGVEYCVNATGFTAADVDRFASGYVPSGSSQNSLSPVATGTLTAAKKNIISQNIDSTNSEVFVVIVSTIFAGNQLTADVACAIQWREIY
jgi:hypothetical protein